MVTKRFLVVALAGLNLFLLVVMLSGAVSLPSALAQPGARGGDYACVTAKAAGQSYDVLYLLDRGDKKLHAFYPGNAQTKKHAYASFRDLNKDFAIAAKP